MPRKTLPTNEANHRICIFVKPSEIAALKKFQKPEICADQIGVVDAICDRVVFAWESSRTATTQKGTKV